MLPKPAAWQVRWLKANCISHWPKESAENNHPYLFLMTTHSTLSVIWFTLSTNKMRVNLEVIDSICHLKNQHSSVLPHSLNCGPAELSWMQHLAWQWLLACVLLGDICWQHHYLKFGCLPGGTTSESRWDSLKIVCCSSQYAAAEILVPFDPSLIKKACHYATA